MMLTVLMLVSGTASSFAEGNIRGTDVIEAKAGCTLVLYKGTFKRADKAAILSKINAYRKEACEKGYPDPRNTSRRLTASDYVPIKWSSDLEWIAQTRAAEASLTMAHKRPNGAGFSITYNGVKSNAEVLAWNNKADYIMHGIGQWYGEKSNWVNKKSGTVTGHYKQMINPDNTYIGIGGFKPPTGYSTVAGEYSKSNGLDETQVGVNGTYYQTVEVADGTIWMPKTKITKLAKGKKSFTVNWDKEQNVTGYKIQYSTSKSFKNAKTITVKKATTVKKTKKKLKAKKKYYVRIRTYTTISGKTFYSGWSKIKAVKTK